MKKRIIFDLDNTIMIWKKDYIKALEKTVEKYNLNVEVKVIDDLIESLEKKYNKISKDILLDEINNTCNLNLNMDFVDCLFENQSVLIDIDDSTIDTLKYLSKKYELVILTNYFKEVQEKRLENAGIRLFFKEIHSGEEYIKPLKDAFYNAIGKYKISECIMVGDSIETDINGAINIGLDVIAVDYFNKIKDTKEYKVVREFDKLKEIL
ncbi:MAG: HAD family hydrolase [bacterium]|nr:HAD family hydrolase [bacterium]